MFAFAYNRGVYLPKYLFTFGGVDSSSNYKSSIDKFDGTSSSANGLSLDTGASNIASANLNLSIYLFGGYYTVPSGGSYVPSYTSTVRKFDGYTSSTSGMPFSGSADDSAASALNSKVFIFGGGYYTGLIGGGQPDVYQYTLNSIKRFDESNITTDSATLQYNMKGMASQTFGSNIFIFAGSYLTSQGTPNPTVYSTYNIQKYDGTTRTTESASTADSGSGLTTASFNSKVWIFGKSLIHQFDGTTRSSTGVTLSVVDSGAGSIKNNGFVFGGTTSGSKTNTIKKWDGTTLTTLSATLTYSINSHAVCEF